MRQTPTSIRTFLRDRYALLTVGAAIEVILLASFVRRYPLVEFYDGDTDIGTITGHSHAGFLAFVTAFVALFTLLGMAYWQVRGDTDIRTLWLVLGFGAVFAGSLAFMYPITAIDMLAYAGQSRILLHYHENPLVVAPASFPSDHILTLSDGWSFLAAPYGPLAVVIDALPALVTRGELLASLIALKLMFAGLLTACAALVYLIAGRVDRRYALGAALFLCWNPFALFEIGGNGHNDVVMILFLLTGIALISRDRFLAGTLILVVAALVKYPAVVFIPPCVMYCAALQRSRRALVRYVVWSVVLGACLVVLAFAPFWDGSHTFDALTVQNSRRTASFSSIWVSLWPANLAASTASIIGVALFLPPYAGTIWAARRSFRHVLASCCIGGLLFLALALNNVEPWYLLWPVALAACVPEDGFRFAVLLGAMGAEIYTALFGFVWVWFGLNSEGYRLVNTLSYSLLFAPTFAALALVWLLRGRDHEPSKRQFEAEAGQPSPDVSAAR